MLQLKANLKIKSNQLKSIQKNYFRWFRFQQLSVGAEVEVEVVTGRLLLVSRPPRLPLPPLPSLRPPPLLFRPDEVAGTNGMNGEEEEDEKEDSPLRSALIIVEEIATEGEVAEVGEEFTSNSLPTPEEDAEEDDEETSRQTADEAGSVVVVKDS